MKQILTALFVLTTSFSALAQTSNRLETFLNGENSDEVLTERLRSLLEAEGHNVMDLTVNWGSQECVGSFVEMTEGYDYACIVPFSAYQIQGNVMLGKTSGGGKYILNLLTASGS